MDGCNCNYSSLLLLTSFLYRLFSRSPVLFCTLLLISQISLYYFASRFPHHYFASHAPFISLLTTYVTYYQFNFSLNPPQLFNFPCTATQSLPQITLNQYLAKHYYSFPHTIMQLFYPINTHVTAHSTGFNHYHSPLVST